jgi:hypothetical protein
VGPKIANRALKRGLL